MCPLYICLPLPAAAKAIPPATDFCYTKRLCRCVAFAAVQLQHCLFLSALLLPTLTFERPLCLKERTNLVLPTLKLTRQALQVKTCCLCCCCGCLCSCR